MPLLDLHMHLMVKAVINMCIRSTAKNFVVHLAFLENVFGELKSGQFLVSILISLIIQLAY